jgi:membrane-associated phospholipid phosphatase
MTASPNDRVTTVHTQAAAALLPHDPVLLDGPGPLTSRLDFARLRAGCSGGSGVAAMRRHAGSGGWFPTGHPSFVLLSLSLLLSLFLLLLLLLSLLLLLLLLLSLLLLLLLLLAPLQAPTRLS